MAGTRVFENKEICKEGCYFLATKKRQNNLEIKLLKIEDNGLVIILVAKVL